jgi:molybdate transport system substrate-binding protein
MLLRSLTALACLASALVVGAPADVTLTVSAAVSLKDAIDPLGRRFERDHPGVVVRFNLGASGELRQQIEAGAPVDVFVSASDDHLIALERQRLTLPATRRVIAQNRLVVAVPARSSIVLTALDALVDARIARIAIGDPTSVPAGHYAQQALRRAGLWDRLQPRLVLAGNVRQVLDYVARDEVDAGFVYASDLVARAAGVREAFRPSTDLTGPIVYAAAVVAASAHAPLAAAFVNLLASADGTSTLTRFGFVAPGAAAR